MISNQSNEVYITHLKRILILFFGITFPVFFVGLELIKDGGPISGGGPICCDPMVCCCPPLSMW